jgi:hypothetical protein
VYGETNFHRDFNCSHADPATTTVIAEEPTTTKAPPVGTPIPIIDVADIPELITAWADEDINFRDGPDVPGYQFDVSLDAQPNFIPVPMLEALFRQVPVAPGARLINVSLESRDRLESSFDADLGLRYFGLEGSIYRATEASFFDPGFFEFIEPTIDGDSWTQDIVVLDRYTGEITVEVDPATSAVQSTVSVRLEPYRPVLEELLES